MVYNANGKKQLIRSFDSSSLMIRKGFISSSFALADYIFYSNAVEQLAVAGVAVISLGSLSTRVFETRTATGSERFSLLTCLHTTAFALPSIFSPFIEMLGIKIWKTPLS